MDILEAVDFYFQICSCEVNCTTMASIASTYANLGRSPISNKYDPSPSPTSPTSPTSPLSPSSPPLSPFLPLPLSPIPHRKVLSGSVVKNTIQLMYTCGMYDYSGEWACKVGIPAKSGVSGVLMVVCDRRRGERGEGVRG